MMAIGYLLRMLRMLDNATISQMSAVTFRVFLSMQIFGNIYSNSIAEIWNGRVFLLTAALTALNFLIAVGVAKMLGRDDSRRYATLTQGMFQNSITTFGIPMVSSAYGTASTGIITISSAILVPIKNVIVVCHMAAVCGKKKEWRGLVLDIARNPFFLAGMFGLAVKLLSIKLPYVVEQTVSGLSKGATPLSLFLLGASLYFKNMRAYRKEIIWSVLIKMLLIPAALMPFAILSGLRGSELMSILIILAAPTATSAPITAKEMGADSELASYLTAVSAAVSMLSLSVFIVLLNARGYL